MASLSRPDMARAAYLEALEQLQAPTVDDSEGDSIDPRDINGEGAPQFPLTLPHGFQGGPVTLVGASPLLTTATEERLRAAFRRMAAPPPPKVQPTAAPKLRLPAGGLLDPRSFRPPQLNVKKKGH
jgi:hypothetical protein